MYQEHSQTYFDERYSDIAGGPTEFSLGEVEEASGVAEMLDDPDIQEAKMGVYLHFFARPNSELQFTEGSIREKFNFVMTQTS